VRVISAFKQSADVLLAVIVPDISFLGLITERVNCAPKLHSDFKYPSALRACLGTREMSYIVIIVITQFC